MRPDYNFHIRVNPKYGYDVFTNGSDHALYGGAWYQVYPGMDRGTSIPYEIEKHRHRRMFNGDLWFVNRTQDDYTLMSQINSTSVEVELRVEMVTGASDWWEGYFSINDGKWDSDRGIFAVTPAPDDAYRSLEAYGDKEYDMIGLSGGLAAIMDTTPSTIDIQSPCTSSSWTDFETNNPQFPADENKGGDDWTNYFPCAACVPTGGAYPPDISPLLVTEDCQDCANGEWKFTWSKQVSVVRIDSTWNWDETEGAYAKGTCSVPSSTVTLNARAFTLEDAIEHIVSDIAGLSYVSTFFKNATNPVLDEFFPGDFTTNPLNYILIYQKSDIKTTSDPATQAMMTFNELMLFIENKYNAFWLIDNGDLRIEHESYFTKSVDFNLTTFDSGYWITNMNKWTYDKEKMPSREHFEWMEASNTDFIGMDIVYDKIASGNKVKDSQLDRILPITTDIEYVYSNESDISNEGWIFLQTSSDYIIGAETGALSTLSKQNNHLSWANLHDHYWKHGRVLDTGKMNDIDTNFSDVQRTIKQVEITYPTYSSDFDPDGLKTTELGDGEVGEAEYLLLDGTIKTVFFYPNVMSPIAPPDESYLVKTTDIWYVLKDIDKVKWDG